MAQPPYLRSAAVFGRARTVSAFDPNNTLLACVTMDTETKTLFSMWTAEHTALQNTASTEAARASRIDEIHMLLSCVHWSGIDGIQDSALVLVENQKAGMKCTNLTSLEVQLAVQAVCIMNRKDVEAVPPTLKNKVIDRKVDKPLRGKKNYTARKNAAVRCVTDFLARYPQEELVLQQWNQAGANQHHLADCLVMILAKFNIPVSDRVRLGLGMHHSPRPRCALAGAPPHDRFVR